MANGKLGIDQPARRKDLKIATKRRGTLGKSRSVRTYTAVIHREDHWYVAACPEVGVVSQGKSIDEAIANLKEATELYLEEFPPPSSERSLITTFDVTHA
ncbi:MAG TPA: type II toxin-antitoxin system HicB family antitoxin [Candidatus Limnocylindrales bacterium]|jgi:predicted RNase H-like HicB family nuclease|nr:type II toxin-antitoxin system HicB family antitoxin [Candidatus Limnocylindrales bacterium]HZM10527.1 type II toxin-antitoxin system HicB family antitoxin [Candidatus Limnocylindrales bacterium]